MLCCLNGAPLNSIALDDLLRHAALQSACRSFKDQLKEPCTRVPADAAYICLLQGEAAALQATRVSGLYIGSQDATTCLTTIIWCPQTHRVWAAHIDQPLSSSDTNLLTDFLQQMQQPQLYIAGAYCDQRGLGPSTAQVVLQQLHSLQERISLQLLCVGAVNTAADGSPCVCQLVLDTGAGTVHPWLFGDRGPGVPRRFAVQECRYPQACHLQHIWDCKQHQLTLQPFDPTVISSWTIMRFELMVDWTDGELLRVLSTSPDHEPPWFCQDMRDKMRFLIDAQNPESTERTAATQTASYRWCSDAHVWKAVVHAGALVGS